MIAAGEQVGSYRVLEILGTGGFGRVYVAEHVRLGRQVALKVLRADYGARPDMVARFITEARAANRIGHEHIVEVTDDGISEAGEHYYVMELLLGEALSSTLRREGALALDRTLHIAIQVADALAASHSAGIVHRDLKPDNVFLINRSGDRDYVKLLDFGIAKLIEPDQPEGPVTRSGMLMGTPTYMSPEQCRGRHGDVDHRADIYALGVLLHQLLTGEVPFRSDAWGDVLIMHVQAPFPNVCAARPELPAEVDAVLQRACAKAPGDRWATMGELRDALRALRNLPPAAAGAPTGRPPRVAPQAAAPPTPDPRGPVAGQLMAAGGGGSARPWLVIGTLVAVASAGTIYVTLGRGGPAPMATRVSAEPVRAARAAPESAPDAAPAAAAPPPAPPPTPAAAPAPRPPVVTPPPAAAAPPVPEEPAAAPPAAIPAAPRRVVRRRASPRRTPPAVSDTVRRQQVLPPD